MESGGIILICILLAFGGVVLLFLLRKFTSPAFLVDFGIEVIKRLIPYFPDLDKRLPPDKEEEMHDTHRRAEDWDTLNKRPRRREK